jgi:hypothetical protein
VPEVVCFHASASPRRGGMSPGEQISKTFRHVDRPERCTPYGAGVEPWPFTQRDGSANNPKGKQNHEHQHPDRLGRPRRPAFWRWRWLLLEKSTLAMANGAHEVRLETEGHGAK